MRFGENGGYLSGNNWVLHGDSLPLAFTISDVSNCRAGSYSDVLTISVAPI